MTYRTTVLLLTLLASCSASAKGSEGQQTASPERPNIVVVYVDDWGWRDAAFQGSRFYETPRMDAFAKEGLVFSDAYAAAPNCAPSRASLMTGRYTPRHGILTVNSSKRGKARDRVLIPIENRRVLEDEELTVAELLRATGYRTAMMGKWHLGEDPRTQGFDVNIGGNQKGHPKSYFSPYGNPDLEDGPEPAGGPGHEYLTDRLTDEALTFIGDSSGQPFFLYLSHFAVHTPIQSREDDAAAFLAKPADGGQSNAKYAGMIAAVDRSLGRVLDRLDELGLRENTLVILTSDNGGHGPVTSNAPLRGAKGMIFEGGLRVPLVMRWPVRIAAGTESSIPVHAIDLLPTLADAAAIGVPMDIEIDGLSLGPIFDGEDFGRDTLYWHFPVYLEGDRTTGGAWRTSPAGALRSGRWKLIEWFETGQLELFDLELDPGEENDLSAEKPELAKRLGLQLESWRTSVGARVPRELEPAYRK
ncbi:MAG: arylsulfatase A-like enzyme [Planctomycetota bacterium]|jgi:arylsulfatase A-like enzyme